MPGGRFAGANSGFIGAGGEIWFDKARKTGTIPKFISEKYAGRAMSRAQKLAAQLLEDRERHAGRTRQRRDRPPGSDFDPFGIGCWQVIAGGDPGYLVATPMRKGPDGFYIACRACGVSFESKGIAYCATCAALPIEERLALKPAFQGRMCQAPGCENFIDREKRANIQFCSPACTQRARRALRRPERRA